MAKKWSMCNDDTNHIRKEKGKLGTRREQGQKSKALRSEKNARKGYLGHVQRENPVAKKKIGGGENRRDSTPGNRH